MSSTPHLLPEETLVAVLAKVGRDVRLVDDQRLASAFDAASGKSTALRPFKKHPQYNYAPRLSNALQVLDLGGSIIRENAPAQYFRPSPHTVGPYGEALFDRLSDEDKRVVEELAEAIRRDFGAK